MTTPFSQSIIRGGGMANGPSPPTPIFMGVQIFSKKKKREYLLDTEDFLGPHCKPLEISAPYLCTPFLVCRHNLHFF